MWIDLAEGLLVGFIFFYSVRRSCRRDDPYRRAYRYGTTGLLCGLLGGGLALCHVKVPLLSGALLLATAIFLWLFLREMDAVERGKKKDD